MRTCIGSSTAAHSAVQVLGMPPAGHSTPAVQQAAVTAWTRGRNSAKLLQLGAEDGAFAGASVTVVVSVTRKGRHRRRRTSDADAGVVVSARRADAAAGALLAARHGRRVLQPTRSRWANCLGDSPRDLLRKCLARQ